jgi:pSer/pThr/pTyr-binding forkhead associated (FHA) protein
MRAYLVATDARPHAMEIPVLVPVFLIGRAARCHLRPRNEQVSKLHCAVLQRADGIYVRDLDSTNGTFVNDQRVTTEVRLSNSDRLRVASLSFALRIREEESVPAMAREALDRSVDELLDTLEAELEAEDTRVQDVSAKTKHMEPGE